MEKIFNHKNVEKNKIYFWKKNNFFSERFLNKKPFSIIMPPPNVTGKLHIGHAWDYSIQDLLIRYKKLHDYDVLYIPGYDHAGIATQSKIEQILLKNSNKTRYDLGKNKLIEQIIKFSNENIKLIKNQWNKLGLSIDESYEYFTFNETFKKIVNEIFVNLYDKGMIYQGTKMIYWDVAQQTALSNIEVEHHKQKGKLYYLKYFLQNNNKEFLLVATTRPETIFVDQALVVNKKDERFKKYINKKVINPINNKIIPVISDDYVSIEYGTGVMKCTPAHDFNDYKIGKKYNLKFDACIDKKGKITKLAGVEYEGLDRFEARKKIISNLKSKNLLFKTENIIHNVVYSQRSNTIVEPLISKQWFILMSKFAKKIITMQNSKEKIIFFPEKFNNNLINWMKEIEDWCISRQIWWGHRIPVWYNNSNNNKIYVSDNPPENLDEWKQDDSVLDTWFSSSLLAFAGLGWKYNTKIFDRFFPSDVLVTGYDIIFFWVSRMIFQTSNLLNKQAFKNILIHGLIRDAKGLKMSKSLNNGIDPMDVIEKYGSDSLRFFLLTNSSPGKDLKYNDEKIKYAWNFINKIWNASRFVVQNIPKNFQFNFKSIFSNNKNKINLWILNEFINFQKMWFKNMEKFEFAIAANELISFFWDKYCCWYIEFSKIIIEENKEEIINVLVYILVQSLKMLHPYIPFVTEDIYQKLKIKESILLERYDSYKDLNLDFTSIIDVNLVIDIISKIREFRSIEKINKNNIKLQFNIISKIKFIDVDINMMNKFFDKIINSKLLEIKNHYDSKQNNVLLTTNYNKVIIEIILTSESKKIIYKKFESQLLKLNDEINRSKKILANKNFLEKANSTKVQLEKDKLKKYEQAKKNILSKIEK